MDGSLGHRSGGIAGLHRLLAEHGEAIEADLARYYHRDLGEVFTGTLTWRQLAVLVGNLPAGSALARALARDDAVWLDPAATLLAAAVEELRVANWQRGGGKGPRPTPIRPVGDPPRRAVRYGGTDLDQAHVHAYLNSRRRR